MDVADWLRMLGLEQYEALFRQNDIDAEVLPTLGADDLRELGIGSLGHRKKLLAAIAALSDGSTVAPKSDTGQQPSASAPASAERRQVTVMFCDLVGSTALATRLDPEDLREVIGAYHRRVAKVVGRYDGFVAKYMGDGVLIYFGYPQAHEDDAERAVRAGLKLVRTMDRVRPRADVSLEVRVGVATGLVVVGDLIGSGEAKERGVVGQTPNLAARLQALSEPKALVIEDGTRQLLGELFEYHDLGAVEVKGYDTPIRAWRVRGHGAAESRYEALHAASPLTPLVGRSEEIELLLRRWQRARKGEGQVVLLSGEPGIGKSRLVAAFQDQIRDESHTRLRNFCSPYHRNSALHPIIAQLERAAGLVRDDDPEKRLEKLTAVLARTEVREDEVAILADLLSIPSELPTELTPQRKKEMTFEALLRQFAGLARQQPLLSLFEDVHWIDPSSRELLDMMVERVRQLSVLLIITFRPEFHPPWTGLSHVTAMGLSRLDQRDGEALVHEVIKNHVGLPEEIVAQIVKHTDGVPLFMEELTKAMLEARRAGTKAAVRTQVAGHSTLAIPPTLQALLMARLDSLGPSAKETAQMAAALGREFSYELLAAIRPGNEVALQSSLDRLVAVGLVFERGVPPQSIYSFKHTLVQDAAYSMLLREPRRALHARIAETLEGHFDEIAESQPELLARHYTEAGLIEKAAGLWGKAGRRSMERSALVETAEQLTRALDQIAHLPGTPTLRREQIGLQVDLCHALFQVKGFAAPETKTAVERAHLLIEEAKKLGEPPEDPVLVFSVLFGFWLVTEAAYNGDELRKFAERFLELAKEQDLRMPLMVGHRLMGITKAFAGEFAGGLAHLNQSLGLFDPVEHRLSAGRFGHDHRVTALQWRGFVSWLLGHREAALADLDQVVKDARQTGQAADLMFALAFTSYTLVLCGAHDEAGARLDELLALADEKRAPYRQSQGMKLKGSLLASSGKSFDAVQMITAGIAASQAIGATLWLPFFLSYLARAYADIGQFGEASRTIADAMTAVETTKERWCEAEVHRVAGEIALRSPEPDAGKAQRHLETALAVAREQQAKSFELRAAMSMARLWRDQAKHRAAHDLLAPVYGWFTEGFDTPDLKEAKDLLNELAS
jgi:class 3 adenylate cyclase/predicted ATPase